MSCFGRGGTFQLLSFLTLIFYIHFIMLLWKEAEAKNKSTKKLSQHWYRLESRWEVVPGEEAAWWQNTIMRWQLLVALSHRSIHLHVVLHNIRNSWEQGPGLTSDLHCVQHLLWSLTQAFWLDGHCFSPQKRERSELSRFVNGQWTKSRSSSTGLERESSIARLCDTVWLCTGKTTLYIWSQHILFISRVTGIL